MGGCVFDEVCSWWCVTGDYLFVISDTFLMFSCSNVSDCHRPTSQFALHVTLFVCLVTKRDLAGTISGDTMSSRSLWQKRSKTRILSVLWVLVKCQLYLVTYNFHRKNTPTTTKLSRNSVVAW